MTCEPLEQVLSAPKLLLGAREAGAGSLLAELLKRSKRSNGVMALLEPPADRYFEGAACEKKVLEGQGPDELAQAASEMIARQQPEQILVGASAGMSIEKMLIEAGKSAGIPTSSIVDHYWNLWQRFAGVKPGDKWRYCPDTIYVPDEKCVQKLGDLDCPAQGIIAFNHPLLAADGPLVDKGLRATARQKIGVSSQATLIVFISEYVFADTQGWQWDQPDENDIFEAAIGLAGLAAELDKQGNEEMRLLIRPHPSEIHNWKAILPKSLQAHVTIDSDLNKSEFFAAADVAFGLNSMLLGEAARVGLSSYSWFPGGHYKGARLAQYESDVVDLARLEDCRKAILVVQARLA